MAIIKTKQLFDEYFASKDEDYQKKVRPQVDRKEVYEYEEKIGKQLIEFNVDEIFEMLLSFNKNGLKAAYTSFPQLSTIYRALWNYYIDNYEVIRNPWNRPELRGTAVIERLMENNKPFTKEDFFDLIKKIHAKYDEDLAKYIECIMLLFYEGFSHASEIVNLKEAMIDFKTNQVKLSGRTVTLSDRCMQLLFFVHKMTKINTWRETYAMVPYQDGYFKFIIKEKEVSTFNDRKESLVEAAINFKISRNVGDKFGVELTSRKIFLLGFYNHICDELGAERVKEIVTGRRNSGDIQLLINYTRAYGIANGGTVAFKRSLRPYME